MKDLGALMLSGKSGRSYTFKIYEFDTMEALDDAIRDFRQAGLYVFANRNIKPSDNNWFTINYIGETDDYSKRDYSSHHKKDEIVSKKSDIWGFCILSGTERERKEIEADLIEKYFPSCNG